MNWSVPRLLSVAGGISGAGNAWAPEAIHDPATGQYILYWATNSTVNGVRKHRIWYARTTDFRSVTAPQVYINRPGSQDIIDTQISVGGWRYYRASGDGQLTIEEANSVLGTWTRLGDLSHMGLTGTTAAEDSRVLARWPSTPVNRLHLPRHNVRSSR